uniref:Syndecan/Neurexin domain-containing protein n=1 Tax=Trichuris muris TaxID=70415 RepID=A0A5S6QJY5_TRIMR
MPLWCPLLLLPLWAIAGVAWTTSNGTAPTEDLLPGSMVQQDDEDLEHEGSGYPYSPEPSPVTPGSFASAGTPTAGPPSSPYNDTLFKGVSTVRPVLRPTVSSGDGRLAAAASTPAAVPSDDERPPGNGAKGEELSTALIVGITVSCIVVSSLCVAMIVYAVLRTRRRHRAA